MKLQRRYSAGNAGTAGTHMSLIDMMAELKDFQTELPDEFNLMWPPENAFDVENDGPAKEHFDLAVKTNKENAVRLERAENRKTNKYVKD